MAYSFNGILNRHTGSNASRTLQWVALRRLESDINLVKSAFWTKSSCVRVISASHQRRRNSCLATQEPGNKRGNRAT
jgi:hypothetical protein